jgi:hypothetical protein
MIIVPPLAVLSGLGLKALYKAPGWRKYLAVVLIIIAPVGACVRVAPRFGLQDKYEAIRKDVDSVIPRDDLVMVEESSMAIRLYQLNRHGWPVRGDITLERIQSLINRGGKWLVLDNPIGDYGPRLTWGFTEPAIRVGPLYAYRAAE